MSVPIPPLFFCRALGDVLFIWAALHKLPDIQFFSDNPRFYRPLGQLFGFNDRIIDDPQKHNLRYMFLPTWSEYGKSIKWIDAFDVICGTYWQGTIPITLATYYQQPFRPLDLKMHNPSADKIYIVWSSHAGRLTSDWHRRKSLPVEVVKEIVKQLNIQDRVIWHRQPIDTEEGNENPTFEQMSSDIKRCCAVISIDSGPLWLAAAMGVPCFGIFTVFDSTAIRIFWERKIHSYEVKNDQFIIPDMVAQIKFWLKMLRSRGCNLKLDLSSGFDEL